MAETQFNLMHLVLLVVLILFVCFLLSPRNRESMTLDKCHCEQCPDACLRMKLSGTLHGCNRNCPSYNPALCELSYRKCLLHGCNVAGVL
jgi:hypothetical protein